MATPAVKHLEVLQANGQISLPAEWIEANGIKAGDQVAIEVLPDGRAILSAPTARALHALDEIGAALRNNGVTLEVLIEDGRTIRADLLKEMYGLDVTDADE